MSNIIDFTPRPWIVKDDANASLLIIDHNNKAFATIHALYCELCDGINDHWLGDRKNTSTGRTLNAILDDMAGVLTR